jgi:glucose-1-phosphate thymidylyltransferase
MKVLILAAGYAVRLKEIAQDTPKPLLEVARRRIINRILDKVARLDGVEKIYIITNDRFFGKFASWLEGSEYRGLISLINDGSTSNETRCGAIKDMEMAIAEGAIDDDLLVVAGDNLFELDLAGFVGFAVKRGGMAVALHDIKDYEAARRFGVVKVDGTGRVTDFEEKPQQPKTTLISTGIYYFPREKLHLIDKYMKTAGLLDAPGYYISWLSRNDKVYGYTFKEKWYDIGDKESLQRADMDYRKKEKGR